ncbi:MAG: S9 family peptidase [Alphaproteobacteria bacterium]|nr:S9 family peptidase [Alphaproteobacteria bacterium]
MPADPAPLKYPETAKGDVVEDYHGVQVADPYRWLEDSDAPETRAWIDAQNALTEAWLSDAPERERIRARLTEAWDFPRSGVPFERGGRYFRSYNDGLSNQEIIYVEDAPFSDDARVLFDPNTWSEDGTVALSGFWVSPDGARVAYARSAAGTDWKELHVRDIETGEDLPDHIRWVKFSGASWTHDGAGFYYSGYDAPEDPDDLEAANYYQKLFYHRVGEAQDQDTLVYERPDQKEWGFGGEVTDDGRWLIISNWVGTERKNRVFVKDLAADGSPVIELIPEFDAYYHLVGSQDTVLWFSTDLDAPNGRVIAVDVDAPGRDAWKELIPERDEPLRGASHVGAHIITTWLKDAHSQVRIHGLDGSEQGEVALPGIGSVGGFGGRADSTETFYAFTTFLTPGSIYRYDPSTGESTLLRAPEVGLSPEAYTVRQVFYTSADGTRIPMFLVHRAGLTLDGQNPTYLYGYGGFNIPLTPSFSVVRRVWLEMGGVLAVANLRGGGEYGGDWHDAGRLANKQNVFDDFHAAAEWLIAEGYTSTPKLAIGGRSNGGLLVGAALTQRPDLYGAALPGVGVLDMLRFHKFTIGWAWVSDYGSSDDPEQFKWLYAYSPLHNVKPGTAYPATLITTGDHDDRVVPGHSFKFAATLQAAQAGPEPVLIRVETQAGHGAGKPTAKLIEEWTDSWTFLVRALDMTLPEGF